MVEVHSVNRPLRQSYASLPSRRSGSGGFFVGDGVRLKLPLHLLARRGLSGGVCVLLIFISRREAETGKRSGQIKLRHGSCGCRDTETVQKME